MRLRAPSVAYRRRLAALALIIGAGATLSLAGTAGAAPVATTSVPVPRAICGPGDLPETAQQGRVPGDDVVSGRAAKGYTCNTRAVGQLGSAGGFKTLRYVDVSGRECAYFDTPPAGVATGKPSGVQVVDMSDPRQPRLATALTSPAMLSPHESLLLNAPRGLLVAVLGNAASGPGVLEVYDVSADCRRPVLRSSSPLGLLGHESGFAPDGRTFYAASAGGGTLTAVDLADPGAPRILTVYRGGRFHGVGVSADGTLLYATDIAQSPLGRAYFGLTPGPGMRVLDASAVQRRVPGASLVELSTVNWADKSVPQSASAVTIGGRRYVVEADEFSSDIVRYDPAASVGAARVIDVQDLRRPKVVSDLRLEVHTLAARSGAQQTDPGAARDMTGYTAHYCSVPRPVEPHLVACSFIRSGLRVFDIRNPRKPREVGYFNPPGQNGGAALSAPVFVPERKEIWYTDGSSGLWVVRLNEAAWPGR